MAILWNQLKQFPEYFYALKGAITVLLMGLPIYVGLRYFIHRRRLVAPWGMTLNFVSVFILFAGLAFLLASPLARYLPPIVITGYLFITCIMAAVSVVSLVDVFFVRHYLSNVKKVYVSPPLRSVIQVGVFCVALLPILRFVLHFNPLTVVAIPTIATAGLALALQDTLKTFIAGIGLGRIVRLGEWITFQDKEGQVVDINWARTVLRTLDGNYVYIPNTLLQTGVFLNYTTTNPTNRAMLKIGVSYDVPPARVKQAMVRCAQGVSGVVASPPPQTHVIDYGDSAVQYGLYYWVEDFSRRAELHDEVSSRIWYAFRRDGIEISYPTRTVRFQRSSNEKERKAERVTQALQHWALAEAFYAEELREVTQHTRARSYDGGEVVIKQGEPGDSLFVISEGQVEVIREGQAAKVLAVLGPGDIFGEMSLLTGSPRSATIRAKGPVDVVEIKKAGLQVVLARRPELSQKLAELMSERQKVVAGDAPAEAPVAETVAPATLAGRIRQFFGL